MTAVCTKPGWYLNITLSKVPYQERTYMATWTALEKSWGNTNNFEVEWRYGLANGKFIDSYSSVSYVSGTASYQSTFTVPENGKWVQVWVRPHEKNEGTENSKWKYLCPWSPKDWNTNWVYVDEYWKPADIPTPSIEVDQYKLTMIARTDSIDYDPNTYQVEFYLVDVEKGYCVLRKLVDVNRSGAWAWLEYNGTAGHRYQVCARGYNKAHQIYGEWSDYSEMVRTAALPVSFESIRAMTSTSVQVRIKKPNMGDHDTIELNYTTNSNDWTSEDSAGESMTVAGTAYQFNIEGMESGKEWYFRIRATNESGSSRWEYYPGTVILGMKPDPPTTWSNTVTAKIGENIVLNWVHNARDGSHMRSAQLELTEGNGTPKTITVDGVEDSETGDYKDEGKYEIDTTKMKDGTTLRWRVRTKGVLDTYSDWSVTREVKLYSPTTLSVALFKSQTSTEGQIQTLDSFPFYVIASAGPNTQKAIGFHISIVSNSSYKKTDYNGETVWVGEGEEVYSHFFDFDSSLDVVEFDDYAVVQDNTLTLKLMPQDVDFESGQSYTVRGTVSTDAGLSAEAYAMLDVHWIDQELYPQADVQVDTEDFTATIIPYAPIIPDTPGDMVDFDEEEGSNAELPLVEDVSLAVYRINYDGSMTLIMDEIGNNRSTAVVDPHPSIDYARYRVVAIDNQTGSVGYNDIEPVAIGQPGIVFQWDESWKESLYVNPIDQQPEGVAGWSGSRLTLPFNVNTTEKTSPDRSLAEYVGQENPVSYFGTQLGISASWSAVIERTDEDRLQLIRKLNRYQGNVYVRNSRGVGYWAVVNLSYDINHGDGEDAILIPISIEVTKVRGGI